MSAGDDWQVGDLALCVDDRPPYIYGGHKECSPKWTDPLRKGCVYTVVKIGLGKTGRLGLKVDPKAGGLASRFRKIKPLSAEEHRSAIIELANDRRVPVEATDQSWALDADFLRDERVEWRAGL